MAWKGIAVLIVFLVLVSLTVLSLLDSGSLPWVQAPERSSPSDWISEEQIKVYPEFVMLSIENATWASFTNTNSMDPFLDEKAHALEVQPDDPLQISPGDIISYQTIHGIVIHRVMAIGEDQQGVYYIVKGDNNTLTDPVKVRFDEVQGVVVAIIY